MIHRFRILSCSAAVLAVVVSANASAEDTASVSPHGEWAQEFETRQEWWSFQPVKSPEIPVPQKVPAALQGGNEVDRFIIDQLQRQFPDASSTHLVSESAAPEVWLRRLYYVTQGLPPDYATVQKFLSELQEAPEGAKDQVYATWVNQTLDSPHFGERWARHWMDWVRYAESHGSEGDPTIPHAWRYRDYLIRALNDDIPYFQLVLEHIAGDLLPNPRYNSELEINESALGSAHYRFVLHGFAPTDALDEQVRFTEDQIDAVTKAFQGLTVACARCHNHKFDAIEQTDFYALYGIMVSSRPALITVDSPERKARHRQSLQALKSEIQSSLAETWLDSLNSLEERLNQLNSESDVLNRPDNPFSAWIRFKKAKSSNNGESSEAIWKELQSRWQESLARVKSREDSNWIKSDEWFLHGVGFEDVDQEVAPTGTWTLNTSEDQIVDEIFPQALITHSISTKRNGIAGSARFMIDDNHLRVSARTAGSGSASARYVVQNYPRNGTVYPVSNYNDGKWRWQRWNLDYWEGDHAHLEWATAADQPVLARTDQERSWFALTDVFVTPKDAPQPNDEWAEWVAPLFSSTEYTCAPESLSDLTRHYQSAIRSAIQAWVRGEMSNAQARFLNACLQQGILPNHPSQLPEELVDLKKRYQEIESDLPVPIRAPGTLNGDRIAQPFFPRGDHKRPSDPTPQGFLAALNDEPYSEEIPARIQLANDIADPENPFTTRVIVNRLWSYCFGQGIVDSPDNFGKLGKTPTHPELLDWLASEFVAEGGSIKDTLRIILNSKAFRLSSIPTPAARQLDPTGSFYSHYQLRRLEAEALRDTLLQISGNLDPSLYGPPVNGASNRRSVYVRVKRNDLDPFLNVFNAPPPSRTTGKRDSTNIPAQSLTLMNDDWVRDRASELARWNLDSSDFDQNDWLQFLYRSVLGRDPETSEIEGASQFLIELEKEAREQTQAIYQLQVNQEKIIQQIQLLELGMRSEWQTKHPQKDTVVTGPEAKAFWDFSESLSDKTGTLEWELRDGAEWKDGAIVLEAGNAHARTSALPFDLNEKTLEVQLVLSDLNQRGGGALSVQTLDGNRFDSIVYAEQSAGEWLAGSDFFNRTQPFQGPKETSANLQPVTITIVFRSSGEIQAFRNGEPYGKSYQSNGPAQFKPGSAQALIGLRHGQPGSGRMLKGKVLRAAIYDRALSPEEVKQSAMRGTDWVSFQTILVAAPAKWQKLWNTLQNNLELSKSRLSELQASQPDESSPDVFARVELAHALLQTKEWIYLR